MAACRMIKSSNLTRGSMTGPARRAIMASTSAPAAAPSPSRLATMTKPVLFDVPVSNNGARIRFLLYKKELEGVVDIVPPAEVGGLKGEAFLALNPQGKMPLLVLPDGTALPESQVIESYFLDKYQGQGPTLMPPTPELRALAALAARIHDLYIAPVQGCMYKPMESKAERAEKLAGIAFQLDVLEKLVLGPFFCGGEISYADGALMPTFVFLTEILPRHFGWKSVFTGRPRLEAWWTAVNGDEAAAKVIKEMQDGLAVWEAADRWQKTGVAEQVADSSYNWSCGC